MKILYEDRSLIIKGLLSKRKIEYKDLKSIEIINNGIVFTTREGAKITAKEGFFDDKENLFKAIREFNIVYQNHNELDGINETYTLEELKDMFLKAKDCAHAVSSPDIKNKLGEKYDIKIEINEEKDLFSMFLSLTEDGKPIKDFDDIVLAYLVEWIPSMNCAKYGITVELSGEEKMVEAVKCSLQYLYEEF